MGWAVITNLSLKQVLHREGGWYSVLGCEQKYGEVLAVTHIEIL